MTPTHHCRRHSTRQTRLELLLSTFESLAEGMPRSVRTPIRYFYCALEASSFRQHIRLRRQHEIKRRRASYQRCIGHAQDISLSHKASLAPTNNVRGVRWQQFGANLELIQLALEVHLFSRYRTRVPSTPRTARTAPPLTPFAQRVR